ncbi:MAG: glycosyltransferase family 2 protein [Candidatus Pacebacteria bacterium]|nr:glycosyltransferase family 2 protein [Candidatus Paceibacterota bacterium]NUQ57084.1 glycosyltransferase family 2 protein [Candidatus Paceibacter sp.]
MTINKLSIIIPVFNEISTIEKILDILEKTDLGGVSKEIIVVDDGSLDGTREILKSYETRHKIVYHEKNQGKGAAVRTGLKIMSGDYAVIQDADLEYNPNDFKRMLEHAVANNAEAIYGSRRLGKGKSPTAGWQYYLGGLFLTFLTNFLYRTKITDEATCYKMVSRRTLENFNLCSDGFEFCPEITAKIARQKITIHEIPIDYTPRSRAEGKKIKLKDGFIAVWTLLKYKIKS